MKAAWFEAFGKAEDVITVGETDTPEPGAGEVLVKVHASGVNPSDVKKRAGANPALLEDGPVIPNSDGAGVIEAVGRGVPKSRIGERVWMYNGQFGRQAGTTAQYIALPAEQAIYLPDAASFDEGACMGIPAMTAHRCVFADGPVAGQIVLVTGGAGRVGYYAIQWAKYGGASVIATVGSEESRQHCLDAGADMVLGHPSEETAAAVMDATGGAGVDRVVEGEFGANLDGVLEMIRPGGVIATYSSMVDKTPQIPFVRMMFMDLTIRMVLVYIMPESAKQEAAEDINDFLEKGRLMHRIAHRVPLEETVRAHQLIEEGGFGGCVIIHP